MKPTGTLTFTKHPDRSVTHKWEGGRRVLVSFRLVETMFGKGSHAGEVLDFGGVQLRLVGREPVVSADPIGMWTSEYIAMREGRLARFVSWYTAHALRWSFVTQKIDFWLMFGRQLLPNDGAVDIPKLSITGLLLRWV